MAGFLDGIKQVLEAAGTLVGLATSLLTLSEKGRKFLKELAKKGATTFLPSGSRKPVLLAISGQLSGMKIELGDEPLAIGRDPRVSNLVFAESASNISKRHCLVSYSASRKAFVLEDCWSLNGTFISSGEMIQPGEPYHLESSGRFYLATPDNQFEVRLEPVSP